MRPTRLLGGWSVALLLAGGFAVASVDHPVSVVASAAPLPLAAASSTVTIATKTDRVTTTHVAPMTTVTESPAPATAAPTSETPVPTTAITRAPTTTVPPATTEDTVEVTVAPTGYGTVEGTVRRPDGSPMAGACVEVWGMQDIGGPSAALTTGADGHYSGRVLLIPRTDMTSVIVRDCTGAVPGLAMQQAGVLTEAGRSSSLDVTLAPGAALRGTVTMPPAYTGPPPGCVIVGSGDSAGQAQLGPDGSFVVTGLLPGEALVAVATACRTSRVDGGATLPSMAPPVALAAGAIADVSVRLL